MTTESQRIAVSGTVEASAAAIFVYLADPGNHVLLDTSGMVRGTATASLIDAPGAVFVMNMRNLTMGDHQVANHVVIYEQDRAIGWAPAEPGSAPVGHTWIWRMAPLGENHATVSLTYDWSAFTHVDMLDHLPVLNRDQLQLSLVRLAAAVESRWPSSVE